MQKYSKNFKKTLKEVVSYYLLLMVLYIFMGIGGLFIPQIAFLFIFIQIIGQIFLRNRVLTNLYNQSRNYYLSLILIMLIQSIYLPMMSNISFILMLFTPVIVNHIYIFMVYKIQQKRIKAMLYFILHDLLYGFALICLMYVMILSLFVSATFVIICFIALLIILTLLKALFLNAEINLAFDNDEQGINVDLNKENSKASANESKVNTETKQAETEQNDCEDNNNVFDVK